MKLAMGADHAGMELKSFLKERLSAQHEIIDVGTHTTDSVDYPAYGGSVARAVLSGVAERGIVICGTGVGISIAANKLPGIRAAVIHDTFSARTSVEHNNLNVLALGARVVGPELAWSVVEAWLNATFTGGRHQRRLDLITDLERSGQ